MKKRILIIDDEPSLLKSMERDLRKLHDKYEVYTNSDSDEAVKLIDEKNIDLLITDIYMPGKEGLELIAEVNEKYPLLKIIAMSGGGSLDRNTCLEVAEKFGASCSLNKPFSRDELIYAIESELLKKALR